MAQEGSSSSFSSSSLVHDIISWCTAVTFFRAELCGGTVMRKRRKKIQPANVFAISMSVGHGISIFGRGPNELLKKIHLEKREANDVSQGPELHWLELGLEHKDMI